MGDGFNKVKVGHHKATINKFYNTIFEFTRTKKCIECIEYSKTTLGFYAGIG